MNFLPGPMELAVILVIVMMLFGVGKLPEIFGAAGKGIRNFRQEMSGASDVVTSKRQPAEVAANNAAVDG